MKIGCYCGGTIHDGTDYLPTKAHFVSDEDFFDLLDELTKVIDLVSASSSSEGVEEQWKFLLWGKKLEYELPQRPLREIADSAIHNIMGRYTRIMYQCNQCGRLYINDWNHQLHCYEPHDEAVLRDILWSDRGKQPTTHLIGRWHTETHWPDKGNLYWHKSQNCESGTEKFNDYEEFEHRYFELFEQLNAEKNLRNASLRKDGEIIHVWYLYPQNA